MASVVRNMVNILGIADVLPSTSEIYKEFTVSDTLCLPCQKPNIERLISSMFDVQVVSLRVINTPAGAVPPKGVIPGIATSSEGEQLTGKKAVVELRIRQKVQYVALESQQSIHGIHNSFMVSEFVVIPATYEVGGECLTAEYMLQNNMLVFTPFLEDANVSMLDERCLCTNLLLLLQLNTKQCLFDKGVITGPIGNVTTFDDSCATLTGKSETEDKEALAKERAEMSLAEGGAAT